MVCGLALLTRLSDISLFWFVSRSIIGRCGADLRCVEDWLLNSEAVLEERICVTMLSESSQNDEKNVPFGWEKCSG